MSNKKNPKQDNPFDFNKSNLFDAIDNNKVEENFFDKNLPNQKDIDLDFKYARPAVPIRKIAGTVPTKRPKLRYVRIAGKNITVIGIVTILTILMVMVLAIRGCISKPTVIASQGNSSKAPQAVSEVVSNEQTAAVPKNDSALWNLKLVNNKSTIGADFIPKTVPIDNTEAIDERVLESYLTMQTDGSKEGMDFYACSGYRPYALQEKLFAEQINTVMAINDCSEEEAKKIAGTVVAVPGTSEHQTGLAIDIVTHEYTSLDEGIEETPELQWLYKNAANYGFILRFPKNKQDVTGIIYEPWHFRYVGVESAKEITGKGITLEEYLAEN